MTIDNLRLLRPGEVEEYDVALMAQALALDYTGTLAQHSLADMLSGETQWWRLVDAGAAEPRGIVETKVLEHPAGRELLVKVVAGERVLVQGRRVAGMLEHFARGAKCRWMSGVSLNDRMARFYERRADMPVVGYVHMRELTKGH